MSRINPDAIQTTTTDSFDHGLTTRVNKGDDSQSGSQIPTPEPRAKLTHFPKSGLDLINKRLSHGDETIQAFDDDGQVRLVNIRSKPEDEADTQQPSPHRETDQKRASFDETPAEIVTDEGVCSPTTNIEYGYEDDDDENDGDGREIADEYYEDEDEFSKHQNELTNLSRQSMVPLHELIAYYQYIQQGNSLSNNKDQPAGGPISRQSSNASQQTTRTKHSYNDDILDCSSSLHRINVINEEKCLRNEQLSQEKAKINELHITKIQVSNTQSENELSTPTDDSSRDEIAVFDESAREEAARSDRRRIRANVILELINSERDFVKHLRDVVEGYLYPARRHPEIFTAERISTIFSNIEQLYEFQRKFLDSLEDCINWEDLAMSEVGHCFLEYESGFSVYHYYCNNHPNATSELQDLYTKPRFVKFFEACRLLQNMIDISLDGFLLTPIQKICKYPLQLNELLKNTDKDHPDHQLVADALESMRNCANLANERKRRIEALADVMLFQEKIDNWFGQKLSDTSSVLIHSGEVSKMTSHSWSQGVQLYLFDHLLLLAKKDLLKRNNLILKGRVSMDSVTEISGADEYKPKKSFKLYCSEQQKWFVFTTRSEKEKDEWIQAFERERNLVETDESDGFHITEKEIGIARRAVQNRKHSRSARYRHKRPDTAIVDQLDLDDANTIMNRTLSLPSCIHPSHVMNFVEDSKIVSGSRKKSSSPNSSSRSPVTGSQFLVDNDTEDSGQLHQQQQQQQQVTGGSWFKKMGSKKLAKSQIYNVNGAGSFSAKQSQTTSPTLGVYSNETAATKYDQLEKRHRDHMVSEEQARLFRLNNDMSPMFTSTSNSNIIITNSISNNNNSHNTTTSKMSPIIAQQSRLNRFSSQQASRVQRDPGDSATTAGQFAGRGQPTVETTVVLSSGRVVRVREDAV